MYDFDIIETPENVELQRKLAGIGSRLLAGFLDTVILGLFYFIIFIAFIIGGVNLLDHIDFSEDLAGWVLAIFILIVFVSYWGYFFLFEYYCNGKTPGKKYMKIRVVQKEGQAVTFSSIAIRNLLRAVDGIGVYSVGGFAMFVTQRIQRLGDLAAGTVVISEEIADYSAKSDGKEKVYADREVRASALDATGLKLEEFQILQNYWLRREQLDADARKRILPRLVKPIMERLGDTLPDESLGFLEQYVGRLMNAALQPQEDDSKESEIEESKE